MKRQLFIATLLLTFILQYTSSIISSAPIFSHKSFRLAVYIAPPIIPADGGRHDCVYVQIQDEDGEPLTLPSNLTVILTSSNLDVGSVTENLVIPAGRSFITTWFNATYKPGVTVITASAQGFTSGTASLRTVNPYSEARPPLKLKVYISPGIFPSVPGLIGNVLVQLVDSNDTPLVTSWNMMVFLTSSNTSILTVSSPITILKGHSYGISHCTVTGDIGEATITAVAQGFQPGDATVKVVNRGGKPMRLALILSPPSLTPDSSFHSSAILVQLLDREGKPTLADRKVKVYVSSSNVEVASVIDEIVTIGRGEPYVQVGLKTGVKKGETTVTVSAQDLEACSATLKIEGFTPYRLKVYVAPPVILAGDITENVVTIQIQDGMGNPTVSPRDLMIHITSSSMSMGLYPPEFEVRLPRGENYAKTFFPATGTPGETSITASAQGLESSTATLRLTVQPLNLTLEVPDKVTLNQTVTVKIEATSRGRPVGNVSLEWTVLGGSIQVLDNKTDAAGKAYLVFVQTSETVSLIVQASKPGYETALISKNVEVVTSKPIRRPKPLEVDILGLKIPLLTLMIVTSCAVAILIGLYLYLKFKREKT